MAKPGSIDIQVRLHEEREQALLERLAVVRREVWANRCEHHPPRTHAVVQAHEAARELITAVGLNLLDVMPPSPEVDLCLDALHLALMHANTAIALHHPENHEEPS